MRRITEMKATTVIKTFLGIRLIIVNATFHCIHEWKNWRNPSDRPSIQRTSRTKINVDTVHACTVCSALPVPCMFKSWSYNDGGHNVPGYGAFGCIMIGLRHKYTCTSNEQKKRKKIDFLLLLGLLFLKVHVLIYLCGMSRYVS